MKNLNRPVPGMLPFATDVKAQLAKPTSMVRMVNTWIPYNPHDPLQNAGQNAKNLQDLLRLPGDSLYKRIYWSFLIVDIIIVELIRRRIIIKYIIEQQLEEAANETDTSSDTSSGTFEGELAAGELDADGNSASSHITEDTKLDDPLNPLRIIMSAIAAMLSVQYVQSLSRMQSALGIGAVPTQEESEAFTAANAHTPAYRELHGHLLNQLSTQSNGFNLQYADVANSFLHRLAAMILLGGKSLSDVQQLDPNMLGKTLGESFDAHLEGLSKIANEACATTNQALQQVGYSMTPSAPPPMPETFLTPSAPPAEAAPTPSAPPAYVTAGGLNSTLVSMGAPRYEELANVTPLERLTQWRLAMVKQMFPSAPTPQNTQRKELAEKAHQDTTPYSTHDAFVGELAHYAEVVGVEFHVLEKAADRSLQQLFPHLAPEVHQAMNEHSAAPTHEIRKSLMQREMDKQMRPQPSAPPVGK